ncbi:CLUMA_CG012236, isoform A [Clunio marinus]|uniref:CLUMA_CG012236, isoform A n=1 Tax=Clunio marinus TaxID=568069 RepID=A0A1J1IFE2_9DIPT|nr:CLUMA_CG012236, isoform A [Clunio marinus]
MEIDIHLCLRNFASKKERKKSQPTDRIKKKKILCEGVKTTNLISCAFIRGAIKRSMKRTIQYTSKLIKRLFSLLLLHFHNDFVSVNFISLDKLETKIESEIKQAVV